MGWLPDSDVTCIGVFAQCQQPSMTMVERHVAPDAVQAAKAVAQPDELVDFHHLRARRGMSQLEIEDQVGSTMAALAGLHLGSPPSPVCYVRYDFVVQ